MLEDRNIDVEAIEEDTMSPVLRAVENIDPLSPVKSPRKYDDVDGIITESPMKKARIEHCKTSIYGSRKPSPKFTMASLSKESDEDTRSLYSRSASSSSSSSGSSSSDSEVDDEVSDDNNNNISKSPVHITDVKLDSRLPKPEPLSPVTKSSAFTSPVKSVLSGAFSSPAQSPNVRKTFSPLQLDKLYSTPSKQTSPAAFPSLFPPVYPSTLMPSLYSHPVVPPIPPTYPHNNLLTTAYPYMANPNTLTKPAPISDEQPLDLSKKPTSNEDEPINLSSKSKQSEKKKSPSIDTMYAGAAAGQGMNANLMSAMMMNPLMMNPSLMMMNQAAMFTSPMQSGMQDVVSYSHTSVLAEFMEVLKKTDSSPVQKLQDNYIKEVSQVEEERIAKLKDTIQDSTTTNAVYDQKRLQLSRYVLCQLAAEKTKLGLSSQPLAPYSPYSKASLSTPLKRTPPSGNTPMSPIAMSSPFHKHLRFLSPPENANTSTESGFLDQTSEGSPPSDGDSSVGSSKFLCQRAIDVLSAWYSQHEDHPYADEDECKSLAFAAGIEPSQVRKWLSNKRMRSGNTLPFNGSVHPKKLQKLIQMKEEYTQLVSASPVKATPPMNIPMSPNSSPMRKKKIERSKRLLDPFAVTTMNDWYNAHLDYPYPTDQEKRDIATKTGITVAQVTCWFANKRNRSNNTKKLSPNQILDRLNKKINKYGEIVSSNGLESPSMVPLPSHIDYANIQS